MELLSAVANRQVGMQPGPFVTCFLTAPKEIPVVICFYIRLEERSKNISKCAAQTVQPLRSHSGNPVLLAPRQQLKTQYVILLAD